MSTLSDLVYAHGFSDPADVEWLHRLAGDGQLLADLAFADIVLWVPTEDDSFIAVAHTRPSGAATLFYRDIVGDRVRPQWRAQVREAFTTGRSRDSKRPGTGLGLALSRRLVERHGGTLHHERPESGGARFVITLPEGGWS